MSITYLSLPPFSRIGERGAIYDLKTIFTQSTESANLSESGKGEKGCDGICRRRVKGAVALSKRGTVLWTIGHSNRSIKDFVTLLKEHEIEVLVDIRSFPTSKIEHFKREEVQQWLSKYGIGYVWLGKELGGHRRGGCEAHIKTQLFKRGVEKLLEFARLRPVCIMCVEKNPKHCHRRFLTADLKERA